ncbi:MAG TPA: ribonuclease III [Burkholderiales bacterium]|nr:ribonuclease III [Burkholderiales bacterium]
MSNDKLASQLGYCFQDERLLRQALTHRSYGTPHNERLEFLGDAALNCAIAALLYKRFPNLPEGNLSRLRASLVNQETLSRIAIDLGLGSRLLLGEGELKSGGFRRPSILADGLEAVFGAAFLDGGFQAAAQIIERLYEPLLTSLDPKTQGKDAKTLLQEFLQGRRLPLPHYRVIDVQGEAHEQHFRVECVIDDLAVTTHGEGASRRAAEQNAAREAYELVRKT